MAFIPARPIVPSARALIFAVLLVATLPVAQGAAQTKAPAPAASPATATATQEAQDRPDTAADGGSRPVEASADAQDRDRRLVLLRLLMLGGGSHRPFGLFR